jgi:twitching motility protein PilT
MNLPSLIDAARQQGASDLHLEAGLPPALRVRGGLKISGDPLPGRLLLAWAHELVGESEWPRFLERRSFDLSRTIQGVRCRINLLHTARGVGFAIRLLSTFQATIDKLNLHPDFKRFVARNTGLILVSGPTGCGKSTTLAALIQEINLAEARHIVTIESPIEYTFRPRRAYIRQREVGRDTPGFAQALLDALREDPDVVMVGEMREPETMRLTLNAAETGHLVLATLHSGTCTEALQRITAAFPAEIQGTVNAQLADCLVAVIAQRLVYRPDLKIRVPECEVLTPTNAVKNFIRTGDLFKIASALETGAEHGMWSFARYRAWLEKRTNWFLPDETPEAPDSEPEDVGAPELRAALPPAPVLSPTRAPAGPTAHAVKKQDGRIEIEPVEEGGFGKILKPPS